MFKTLTLCVLLLVSGCASVAEASRLVDVNIVSRATGQRLQTYRHRGQLYVIGTPGERYAVEIVNHGGGRLLTVLAVDGVNAVTGQTAAAAQSGYVLDEGGSAELRGWRKSMDDVAAFYFTALPDSYAARTNRPDNVGVIGVAVFPERMEARDESEIGRQSAPLSTPLSTPLSATDAFNGPARQAAAPPASKAATADARGALAEPSMEAKMNAKRERLGTGHGERLNDPTRYTAFQRASSVPTEVVTIYYDSRENLLARGIIPRPARYEHPRPQAFPGGFVADPA